MDTVSPEVRSANMRAIRSLNTKPEKAVRSIAHAMGLRFRLHRRDLPGTPDFVLPKHRTAVFVHGCFWHRHEGCRAASIPKTRTDYWQAKFDRNVARDAKARSELTALGWKVVVVWECDVKDREAVRTRLRNTLSCDSPASTMNDQSN